MSQSEKTKQSVNPGELYLPLGPFEIHQGGKPVVRSNSVPLGADGKSLELSLDNLSFYTPPEEKKASIAEIQKTFAEAMKDPTVQARLKLTQELERLKKGAELLAKLDETSKQKNVDPEIIRKHQTLIGNTIDLEGLHKRLFLHANRLLRPEGHPVDAKVYTEVVNELFQIFYGKTDKPYFTAQEIQKIFQSQNIVTVEALLQELVILSSGKEIGKTRPPKELLSHIE